MVKEIDFLKEVTNRQLAIITALNDIIGGEMNDGTTSNILNYSRWEKRLIEAVKEEREACAKEMDARGYTSAADVIRARGEA